MKRDFSMYSFSVIPPPPPPPNLPPKRSQRVYTNVRITDVVNRYENCNTIKIQVKVTFLLTLWHYSYTNIANSNT